MTETNTHKTVKILFKEPELESNTLQEGTMTIEELYKTSDPFVWVKNACGDERCVSRRDFHVVDDEFSQKDHAIVCDIDGVLNFIPKGHRDRILLEDGEACQWTELNLSSTAVCNTDMFKLLAFFYNQGKKLVFLTARGDSQRLHTEIWLRKGFTEIGYSHIEFTLFMRGWSCNDLEAPAMKSQMMQSCILPVYDVDFFFEDCPKNVAAMREACPHIPIMQIHG